MDPLTAWSSARSTQRPSNGFATLLRATSHSRRVATSSDSSVVPTPVLPADPDDGSVGARLVALSREAGHAVVVSQIQHALGRATCPSCAVVFDIPDALA